MSKKKTGLIITFLLLISFIAINEFAFQDESPNFIADDDLDYRVPFNYEYSSKSCEYDISGVALVGNNIDGKRNILVNVVAGVNINDGISADVILDESRMMDSLSVSYAGYVKNSYWTFVDEKNKTRLNGLYTSIDTIDIEAIINIRKKRSFNKCSNYKILGSFQCVVDNDDVANGSSELSWTFGDDEWHSVSLKKVSN